MSVLFDKYNVGLPTKSYKASQARRKEDDLLVFGYACKLFEDREKPANFDPEKNLISWMGDESLRIDRYDARLYFTDKAQFTTKPSELASPFTPEEEEMERQCDEERYMDLNRDMAEYETYQEEEMKRFQQALQEDGAYNSVSFSYQHDTSEYPQSATQYEPVNTGSAIHQSQQVSSASPSPPPTPPLFQEPEPFVPPDELEVPPGMEIPETAKMQAIIERTAVFVAKQGKQMEILIKAKQSGNPQFDFLLMDNWLNPYYKHVLKYITEGKYVPEIPNQPSPQPQEEPQESDSEDESDGEYELHPLLQASLHKKITRTQPSSASLSPVPQSLGNKFNRTFAPVTSGLSSTAYAHDQNDGCNSHISGMDEGFDYSMWYPQDDMYGHYASSAGYTYHHPVAHVPSVADMIPPPPPPPGEGPLEEEWLDSTSSVPPLPPPPPPPVPPGLFVPETVEIPEPFRPPPPPPPGMSTVPLVPQQIIPPPPDLQHIVDKLAVYVAKNGPDFETSIKAKNDPRFEFLNPWNTHYSYYILKKQEALAQLEKTTKPEENEKNSSEVSKGPISFSIKAKDMKKPKIEYRSSVIYKQSCEHGESDEEPGEEGSETEAGQEKNDTNEKQSGENVDSYQEQSNDQTPAEELNQQMDSIKAAERIAQHLESESRDKQLQLERRRKASLFISMLKKTNPGDEAESNQSSESSAGRSRKFMETKQDTRSESPSAKRSRIDDDDDDLLSGGVGSPSPGSIRVTQDLMAKVLAASKNK